VLFREVTRGSEIMNECRTRVLEPTRKSTDDAVRKPAKAGSAQRLEG
jgi:hypothetical protein